MTSWFTFSMLLWMVFYYLNPLFVPFLSLFWMFFFLRVFFLCVFVVCFLSLAMQKCKKTTRYFNRFKSHNIKRLRVCFFYRPLPLYFSVLFTFFYCVSLHDNRPDGGSRTVSITRCVAASRASRRCRASATGLTASSATARTTACTA